MKPPSTNRLYAAVWSPVSEGIPYDHEYALWYRLSQFPMMVRLSAYPPMPRA